MSASVERVLDFIFYAVPSDCIVYLLAGSFCNSCILVSVGVYIDSFCRCCGAFHKLNSFFSAVVTLEEQAVYLVLW